MIDVVTLDELREVRRRLAEECGYDIHRYAEMLREMAAKSKAKYITEPLPREAEVTVPVREKLSGPDILPPALPTPVSSTSTPTSGPGRTG